MTVSQKPQPITPEGGTSKGLPPELDLATQSCSEDRDDTQLWGYERVFFAIKTPLEANVGGPRPLGSISRPCPEMSVIREAPQRPPSFFMPCLELPKLGVDPGKCPVYGTVWYGTSYTISVVNVYLQ